MSVQYQGIRALRTLLDSRKASATELAQESLQLARASASLNAFTDIRDELTLAQAKAADARLASGEQSALLGIPMAHKDIFVTQGWASTAGSNMLKGYLSPFDAEVVDRLNKAGMVNVGKVNCDEFAMGSSNEKSAFGPCHNPWDTQAVPGGSSGGSAVAVASGVVPMATGTDTGGSIRQPASLCGITGIKPTYGSCSRYGMIAYASSLDQAGPMARTAEDCALVLNAMVGFDTKDSTSVERPRAGQEDFTGLLGQPLKNGDATQPLKGLRVGLPAEFFCDGLSADVRAPIDAALRQLEQLGATLVNISLPRTELSIPAYYVIAPAEASSNLSRFDGVRYGHRASDYTDLKSMYENSRSEGFGLEVQRRIMIGAYVLSHGYYDAYYLQAQKVRRLIAQDFQSAFTQCDVIAGPVSPTVAWNIGALNADPIQMYLADIYTLGASLAGLPGMSVPVGFGQGNRPVGMQLIGNYFQEGELLAVADHYQRHSDWHLRTPA
ncbi:MAG: Asp-tRNA(Asn)/Glu-tRNA(Gln) amidotransferase subunit GatA [Limnobacter sp.]|uniref:Asp-tRNA(Asn)/Glu-tRNA(Gln) amidotransferase subunit GatA n=1 Tax=Limnobacter sp. TaxID=2003368 RepID=UPI0039189565